MAPHGRMVRCFASIGTRTGWKTAEVYQECPSRCFDMIPSATRPLVLRSSTTNLTAIRLHRDGRCADRRA